MRRGPAFAPLVWAVGAALLAVPWPVLGASVLISEVLYDAVGSDDGWVFIELFGPPGFDLGGYTVEGVNGANGRIEPLIPLAGRIPDDRFFVVADRTAGQTYVLEADLLADFDFQNGPDSVVLRNPTGGRVDAVGYGAFAASDFFVGEGSAAPDVPPGSSLARRFADVDTDDNRADFGVLAGPSPGFGAQQVPEPSALPLVGATLVLLLLARIGSGWPKGQESTPQG